MSDKVMCNQEENCMKIQTFVFLDMETTGLMNKKRIPNVLPKIAELSLVAVSRNNLQTSGSEIPRVLNKLVLLFNPQKVIPTKVILMTDLDNENLENEQIFDSDTITMISHFLKKLSPPICFVAHNGNSFDYPILLETCKQVNKELPTSILCIDTLPYFRNYFNESNTFIANCNHNALMNDEWNDILLSAIPLESFLDGSGDTKDSTVQSIVQPVTPGPSNVAPDHTYTKTKEKMFLENENEKTLSKMSTKVRKVRCNFERPVKKLGNFKLETIYMSLMNGVPDYLHTAEGDCIALLKCCKLICQHFVPWADKNAKLFNTQ